MGRRRSTLIIACCAPDAGRDAAAIASATVASLTGSAALGFGAASLLRFSCYCCTGLLRSAAVVSGMALNLPQAPYRALLRPDSANAARRRPCPPRHASDQ